jgi:hypothetical protein
MYGQMTPVQNAEVQTGYALLIFLGAIGQTLQDLDYLAHAPDASHPVWFNLIDLDAVPDAGVPWLGQFIGIRAAPGLTVAQQRQQIRDHISWQRGTPAAIASGVRLFLTGTQTVQIAERDTGPYHFTITINTAEAPADTTALVNYVNNFAKPAGLTWTLVVGTAPPATYGSIYTRGDTYITMYQSFQTYNDVH